MSLEPDFRSRGLRALMRLLFTLKEDLGYLPDELPPAFDLPGLGRINPQVHVSRDTTLQASAPTSQTEVVRAELVRPNGNVSQVILKHSRRHRDEVSHCTGHLPSFWLQIVPCLERIPEQLPISLDKPAHPLWPCKDFCWFPGCSDYCLAYHKTRHQHNIYHHTCSEVSLLALPRKTAVILLVY